MPRPNSEEVDYEAALNKPPTSLHTHFADWILEKTGLEFDTKKAEQAFYEGVRLGCLLRMAHQASPENQERRANDRAAKEEESEAAAAERAEKKAARAEKRAAEKDEVGAKREARRGPGRPKKAVAAQVDDEDEDDEEEAPAPKRRGRPARAAAAAPARSTRTAGRRAARGAGRVRGAEKAESDGDAEDTETPAAKPTRRRAGARRTATSAKPTAEAPF